MTQADDEFYIGYEGPVPPRMARRVRRALVVVALATAVVAATVVVAQRPYAAASFEYARPREWSGRLVLDPYPALIDLEANTRTLVVAPGKFGADALARDFAGRDVMLFGEGIARDGGRMVQLRPGSIAEAPPAAGPPPRAETAVPMGRVTLRGEVVDSKCFLGVMNPGERAVHRDCAVRCLSGGIPPMLVVRRAGWDTHVVVVSPDGGPMGRALLGLAAQTVDVTGDLERRQDALYLRAGRDAFRIAPRDR